MKKDKESVWGDPGDPGDLGDLGLYYEFERQEMEWKRGCEKRFDACEKRFDEQKNTEKVVKVLEKTLSETGQTMKHFDNELSLLRGKLYNECDKYSKRLSATVDSTNRLRNQVEKLAVQVERLSRNVQVVQTCVDQVVLAPATPSPRQKRRKKHIVGPMKAYKTGRLTFYLPVNPFERKFPQGKGGDDEIEEIESWGDDE